MRDETHVNLETPLINRPELSARQQISSHTDGLLEYAIETNAISVYYGDFLAVKQVSMGYAKNEITALIGPSGCGKSTVLRALNRMNDLIPSARVEGEVHFHGRNIYDDDVDPVQVRRSIGMVFQKPNPFPKSIFDNGAWGGKIN